MVSKGDLFKSVKLYKLNKTQSFELIFEAIINNVLIFELNNVKYDPSEVIHDIIDVIWEEPFNPKKEFKYGKYNGNIKVSDEYLRENINCLSSGDCFLVIFFSSVNPKFNS